MATPSWKRAGSPIGRTGPRKANPKYKQRLGQPWTREEGRRSRLLGLTISMPRPTAATSTAPRSSAVSTSGAGRAS